MRTFALALLASLLLLAPAAQAAAAHHDKDAKDHHADAGPRDERHVPKAPPLVAPHPPREAPISQVPVAIAATAPPSSPPRPTVAPAAKDDTPRTPTVPESRLARVDASFVPIAPWHPAGPVAVPPALGAAQLPTGGDSPWTLLLPVLGLVASGALLSIPRRVHAVERLPPAAPPATRLEPAPMLRAGQVAVARGGLAEALAWFGLAATLEPTLAVAHFCRGACLAELGMNEEAYAALSRALDLDPTDAGARYQMARVAARLGDPATAMGLLAPLLCLAPDSAPAMVADESFAALSDHPAWLAMTGRL